MTRKKSGKVEQKAAPKADVSPVAVDSQAPANTTEQEESVFSIE